ncbi:MAG TPA: hypothetical protein VFE90_01465 [Myxococcales bacterium]|jgi:hypothetical protein|nr:hypothetical protein [Myxococcales bacterium]
MTSGLMAFTLLHVVLSLIAIGSGFVVAGGLISGKSLDGWTGAFLFTTAATSLSGFGFPFTTFLPSHAVAIVSLAVLVVVVLARYFKDLAGGWRRTYVTGAVLALYLNVFVLLAQLFLRLPALMQAAPSQKESPFVITQLVTLALFAGLGWAAIRGFHVDADEAGAPADHL